MRSRLKVATDICKTLGLAALAGGLLEPLVRHQLYQWTNWAAAGLGLAFLASAIYIAPFGEKHE